MISLMTRSDGTITAAAPAELTWPGDGEPVCIQFADAFVGSCS